MQTHKTHVRISMRHFTNIAVPPAREEPDMTDPAKNDFIPKDEAITPPEWAPDGEHRPSDPYADPAKNDWIPAIP